MVVRGEKRTQVGRQEGRVAVLGIHVRAGFNERLGNFHIAVQRGHMQRRIAQVVFALHHSGVSLDERQGLLQIALAGGVMDGVCLGRGTAGQRQGDDERHAAGGDFKDIQTGGRGEAWKRFHYSSSKPNKFTQFRPGALNRYAQIIRPLPGAAWLAFTRRDRFSSPLTFSAPLRSPAHRWSCLNSPCTAPAPSSLQTRCMDSCCCPDRSRPP
jgi:hypothetical protein